MARGRLVVLFAPLVMGALCGAAACTTASNPPLGTGDRVSVDVDSSTLLEQGQPDAYPEDSPFAPVDGSAIYGSKYDSYAVLTVCEPPDGSAGAEPEGGPSDGGPSDAVAHASAEGGADGGAAGPAPADGDAANGCMPFPASCQGEANPCVCLFGAFAAQIPCTYPSCGVQKGFSIYCPP